jgi:hypothetical protein
VLREHHRESFQRLGMLEGFDLAEPTEVAAGQLTSVSRERPSPVSSYERRSSGVAHAKTSRHAAVSAITVRCDTEHWVEAKCRETIPFSTRFVAVDGSDQTARFVLHRGTDKANKRRIWVR